MSNNRICWLHLSDVHVGKDPHGQDVQFRSLINHVTTELAPRDKHLDFVFFTGDIANVGTRDQYDTFNTQLIIPLQKLLPDTKFFAVPGNHDLDHDEAPYVSRDKIASVSPRFFDPTREGQKNRAHIIPMFRAFLEEDRSNFDLVDDCHWLQSKAGVGTFETKKGDVSIGILGLNTAWLSEIGRKDSDLMAITPGMALIEQGLMQLQNAQVKIVLGHHPIGWYTEHEASAIRALLGRYGAIYLHGHLHKTKNTQEEGAGYGFRCIQSGALFQARDEEQWVNRILWTELDVATNKLFARPLQWGGHTFRDWLIDGKAFPPRYRLPHSDVWVIPGAYSEGQEPLVGDPMSGWSHLNESYLSSLHQASTEDILKYFNGRIPSIGITLNPGLPRREIVEELCNTILHQADNVTRTTIIIGAAGEGKSTALQQVALGVVMEKSDWNVLYRTESLEGEPDQLVRLLSKKGGKWLICADDADTVDEYLLCVAKAAKRNNEVTIHLLCAARDTDWHPSHGFGRGRRSISYEFKTLLNSSYSERLLRGLTLSDARKIVDGWARFGDEAMGQLQGQSADTAARQMVEVANFEAAKRHSEGSFFGALLRLRIGSDLKTHIFNLLQRLDSRTINGKTDEKLFKPLAFIACMHAANCLYLTTDVLARALNLRVGLVKSDLLVSLGEEAGVESHGHEFLLTRHRAVAEAIVDVMEQHWGKEPEEYLGELAEAVENMYETGDYHGPDFFSTWRKLPDHLLKQGKKKCALSVARVINEASTNDIHTWIILSKVYLQNERTDLALSTIRSSPEMVSLNRSALIGISNIFKNCTENECSGIAAWYALSESTGQITKDSAKKSLVALSTMLLDARKKNTDRILVEGSTAAAALYKYLESDIGLHYKVQNAFDEAKKIGIVIGGDILSNFKQLRTIMKQLTEKQEKSLPPSFHKMRDWPFGELALLLCLDQWQGL